MTIHIFIAHMGIGGAERVCVNLANEFADRGNEVHIIVLNLENDVNTHLLREKVSVHSLHVTRLRYSAMAMLRYIKTYQPKFLFVFGNEMAVILNKMKKFRLITTPLIVRVLNNVEISLSKEDNVSPIVEKYLKRAQKQLQDMEHVIAQCDGMRDMLLKNQLVREKQVTTVYNPVSSELIAKTEAIRIPFSKREPERTKEIVFIGRIDPQKNLEHLIRAFSMAKKQYPKLLLRMVGNGNVLEQIKQLTRELNLTDSVIFDGIRKDMEQVYAGADVVALSSEYEGMPNCLIEAIGCGIPVVSYDCPLGPKEIVVDGVNGYLVEYNNIEQLRDRLLDAVNREWNEAEIQKTADKFRVEQIAVKYHEIFQRVTENTREESGKQ